MLLGCFTKGLFLLWGVDAIEFMYLFIAGLFLANHIPAEVERQDAASMTIKDDENMIY